MRIALPIAFIVATATAEPLPIDDLWKSEEFRKTVTGSFGIDARIEPRITTDEEFYLDKAAEAMSNGDRGAAITLLTESSILEESPSMLFTLATHQLEAAEPEDAITNFEKALALYPNFRDAHRNLAIALVQQEKYDRAKTHLIRAIELGSREGITTGLLGYCHAIDGNYRAANEAYRLATLTQPENRQWIEGLAQTFSALDHSEDAADLYQQLLDDEPSELQPWLSQADAFVDLDQTPAAIANLELALRADRLEPVGLVSLGHLYLQEDLTQIAVDRYETALAGDIPIGKAVEVLEQLTTRQHWEHARRIAGMIASEPDDASLNSRLVRARALIELEIGDRQRGAKLVEGWLSREPSDGLAILLLARFRKEEGQREEAEMLLERAARNPEVAAEAHLAHGKLLVEAGEYEAAVEHLESARNLDPKPSVADYLEAVRELADGR